MIRNTLAFFYAIALLFVVFFALKNIYDLYSPTAKWVDARANTYLFKNIEWAEEYWKEFKEAAHMRWEPYVYFRRKEFNGKYINISSEGIRKTCPKNNGPVVWFFGGSSVWGTGARDQYTIPSLFAQKTKFQCVNYGESGYVNTQEMILLIRLLQAGKKPDIVIFINGNNDVHAGIQSGSTAQPLNEFNRRAEFNLIKRPQFKERKKRKKQRNKEMSQLHMDLETEKSIVNSYKANIEIIQTLSEKYEFDTWFFLQPVVFSKKIKSIDEKQAAQGLGEKAHFFKQVYQRIRTEITNDKFRDLSQIFDNYEKPIFIDNCHLSENGNEMLVNEIIKIIQ